MAAAHPPVNAVLRDAIKASGLSIRRLSRDLSLRSDVQATAESVRRTLGRFLSGREAISERWARVLEDQLGLQDGTLREPDYSLAISLATQFVRRLEAGETLPQELVLEAADAVDAAGLQARRLADRLRRDALGQPPRAS